MSTRNSFLIYNIKRMYYENINQKKGVITHKIDFRPKKITRDMKEHYIRIKVSTYQEDKRVYSLESYRHKDRGAC